MQVTILSAYLDKKNQEVVIEAENSDDVNLMRLERIRDDHVQQDLRFIFPLVDRHSRTYIIKWLSQQKKVKEIRKTAQPSWNDCLQAVRGTYVTLNSRYLEVEP